MKLKHIIPLLLLLPMLSACNQEDDVIEIFTGKTWKLTGIFYDKGNKGNDPGWCMDYWNNKDEKEASDKLFEEKGNFTIDFTGVIYDGNVTGSYIGRAANNDIQGKWTANGKNNSFNITERNNPNSNEDLLGKAFINALISADRYEGDINNLRIYFQDQIGKDRRFLMFHVTN